MRVSKQVRESRKEREKECVYLYGSGFRVKWQPVLSRYSLLLWHTDLKGHQKATTPHSWASIPRDVICQYPMSLPYMTGISITGFSRCSCRDGARLRRNTTPRQEEANAHSYQMHVERASRAASKWRECEDILHGCAGQSHWLWQSPSSLKQRLTGLDYNTSALSRALQRQNTLSRKGTALDTGWHTGTKQTKHSCTLANSQ